MLIFFENEVSKIDAIFCNFNFAIHRDSYGDKFVSENDVIFAIQCIGLQKMTSFSLTGKIGAPPRRAAKLGLQKNGIVFCLQICPLQFFELGSRRAAPRAANLTSPHRTPQRALLQSATRLQMLGLQTLLAALAAPLAALATALAAALATALAAPP